jgi:hypothetical protein
LKSNQLQALLRTLEPTINPTTEPSIEPTPVVEQPEPIPSLTPTLPPSNTPQPTPSTTNPNPSTQLRAIVFSEINWSGSSASSDDEWIELYNNSDEEIDLSNYKISGLTGTSVLNLESTIKPKDFYLISNFDLNSPNTLLKTQPDLVSTKVALTNTKFNLRLYKFESNQEILIDEVNTNQTKPFAGTTGPNFSSMERINFNSDGNLATNWRSSSSRKNIKPFLNQSNECKLDQATPMSLPTPITSTEIIYFSDICINHGQITDQGSLVLTNTSEEKLIFSFNKNLQNELYKLRLIGNGSFESAKFDLTYGDKTFEKRIQSDNFNLNKEFSFYLSPITKEMRIDFVSNILNGQTLTLEKIILEKVNRDLLPNEEAIQFNLNGSQQKLIEFESTDFCLKNTSCELQFPISLVSQANINPSEPIISGYFGYKNQSEKDFTVKHFYLSDFSNNNLDLSFVKNSSNPSLISFTLVQNQPISIQVSQGKFISRTSPQVELISRKKINWANLLRLHSANSSNGFNGKLIDILDSSSKLSPGNHELSFRIKKLENFSTGKDFIKVIGHDEKGTKIFEKVLDENDLEFNKEMTIKIPISMKASSRITTKIFFYGNHFGAQSDVEFGKMVLL